MPVPPKRLKESTAGTVHHHASTRWPALEGDALRGLAVWLYRTA